MYMGEKNRHFSREFKRDAVQLVTEKGMPVGKVAHRRHKTYQAYNLVS
jgi:transposase-like protein